MSELLPISSQTPAVTWAAYVFATIHVGFGINAILRPTHALTFFEFKPPADKGARDLVNSLMAVYGARDIFMGFALYATAFYGSSQALAWILFSATGVAIADGMVCYSHGKGYWSHWSHAPMFSAVGLVLLGTFD
ncbi:uncharacterized protein JN550_010076 [Neoarthrinium moseri]|uniref:uncharacterized protein n=1 Tax=Neoarthrinium moseri TaxID=1658444 RepID=UPI001FDE6233|nr:uncharacterized protein JN550_010076 [Neoarthrinium moseri]KAI1862739.1 hypothetical protein JN550_010076 [Neoarthrinium moseri]